MLVSTLANLRSQVSMTPNLETAIAFLEKSGGSELPAGRVVVDGDKVYVEVQAYETLSGEIEKLEAHRRYLDIQYVVEGDETIGWVSTDEVSETDSYNEENDYWLGTAPGERISEVKLTSGQLALFYPTDMHAPRRASGAPGNVSKLVVKVEI